MSDSFPEKAFQKQTKWIDAHGIKGFSYNHQNTVMVSLDIQEALGAVENCGAQVFQPTLPIKICLDDTDRARNPQNAGSKEGKSELDTPEEEFQPQNIGNTSGKDVIETHSLRGSDNTPNNTPESSPPIFVDANSATPISTPKAQIMQPNFIIGRDKPGFTQNPTRNEGNFSYDSHISNIEDEGYLLQNLVTYTNKVNDTTSDNMMHPPPPPSEVENTAGRGHSMLSAKRNGKRGGKPH
ncbi:hypothetical protein JTB14_036758 [Gonioctena quinquepunctata]|nr:hypothetical protein JTB14_036758 [Gonioctena quinquepunctata]